MMRVTWFGTCSAEAPIVFDEVVLLLVSQVRFLIELEMQLFVRSKGSYVRSDLPRRARKKARSVAMKRVSIGTTILGKSIV